MGPIAWLSQLIPTSRGHHKCRENWPEGSYERVYNLFLDVVLLVAPLVILAVTYALITRTLWRGIKTYENSDQQNQGNKIILFTKISEQINVNSERIVYIHSIALKYVLSLYKF